MFACLSDCRCGDGCSDDVVASGDANEAIIKHITTEERRFREKERKQHQELQRRTEEAQSLRRQEEEAKRQSQDLAEKVRQLKGALKEEQALFEQVRRERELLERTVEAKDEEGRKMLEERERMLRRTAVMTFLKEHGFSSVTSSKKVMLKTTYPLHVAAEAGNAKMVDMLIKEGAQPDQTNSQGKTAAQVAQAAQVKKGAMDDAHEEVLSVLQGLRRARVGGA
uniref:Uncharacterized protein n=1 Tax=Alexandrium monilatum TaxID=311494 RepID=A0A7S4RXX3_9DINO